MARKSLQARALTRAVEILGAVELSRRLGVSQTRLNLYADGFEPMPEALFLRVVDVLVDVQLAELMKPVPAQKNGNRKPR